MVHISEQKKITHFLRSDNIICLPSSNTIDILDQLLASLYEKYQQDLKITHASSSFIYESVEECNFDFIKIDLRRGASYIETPNCLKSKKSTINPKNTQDVYCFTYAATIAFFHKESGTNPERISQKLRIYTQRFNWHDIDFPASYVDYAIFEKLNEDIALNILPYREKTLCPEYISKRNFNTKDQTTLLKITDETKKRTFLSTPQYTR